MRALDALLSIAQFTGSLIPGWAQRPYEVGELRLTHVVHSDLGTFSLNADTSVRVSDFSPSIKVKEQMIPHFTQHTDSESVLRSWRETLESKVQKSLLHPTVSSVSPLLSPREDPQQWRVAPRIVPDIKDKDTVLTMAKLAANAYVPTPHEGDWSDVNGTDPYYWDHGKGGYGWDEDGLRGYVFTSQDKKTMVLSIKGTSTAVYDSGGPTAPNDKINDNLFFSCCCARITRMWSTVCDCYMGDGQCDEVCLERELLREDRYYREILEVFANAKALAPEARVIWLTGHSLGGALASMLGRTYGLPVVTFEAPGDDLPVRRLHLPVPPGLPPWEDYVWHFGHNADPIYMGTCSGGSSTCWLKGYAMETKCHSGQVCLYDVKKDLGWHESIVNHRIHVVIDNVLEVYDEPALCVTPGPCEDCSEWEFIDPLDVPGTDPDPDPNPNPSNSMTSFTRPTPTKTSSSKSPKPTTDKPDKPTPTDGLTSSCLSRAWYGKCESWTTFPTSSSRKLTTTCIDRNWIGQCEAYATSTVNVAAMKTP